MPAGTLLGSFLILLSVATAQEPPALPPSPMTRAQQEEFLLKARIVAGDAQSAVARSSWRVTLDDGQRKHAAGVLTATSRAPSEPDYRVHIAAYELDKLLELNLVVTTVERSVEGRPAAFSWWVDDVLMAELDRRRQKIDPPDQGRWNAEMQAVRVFDELIANAYRDVAPAAYTSSVWDNLLITREWRVWLIDHTRTFAANRQLEHPESLTRCDRTMLNRLRELNAESVRARLGRFLSSEQLDALEHRRLLIVEHFDALIATKGELAVLYDLRQR